MDYTNTINEVIEYLKDERNKSIKAHVSKKFYDNSTLEKNIRILQEGINAMEQQLEVEYKHNDKPVEL